MYSFPSFLRNSRTNLDIQCCRTIGDIGVMSSGTCSSTVLVLRCLAHSVQREKHHNVSICVDLGTAALRAFCTALSDIGEANRGVFAMESTELADGLSSILQAAGTLLTDDDYCSRLTVGGSSRSSCESHSHPSGYINLKLSWSFWSIFLFLGWESTLSTEWLVWKRFCNIKHCSGSVHHLKKQLSLCSNGCFCDLIGWPGSAVVMEQTHQTGSKNLPFVSEVWYKYLIRWNGQFI